MTSTAFRRPLPLPRVLALVTAAGLALTACSGGSDEAPGGDGGDVTQVVVAHAAGVNGEAVEALLPQFTEETGIEAVGITMSDTDYGAKLQLAARSERADFDVSLGVAEDVFAITEESGIYGDLDTSNWDADDLSALEDAGLIGPNWVVSQQTAALLVASDTLEAQPETWADFFDTDRFPGNRGMASAGLGVPINIEYANIAQGTAVEDLYPLDIETGIKRISAMGGQVVLWDNAPKAIQDVVAGDTAMTWAYAPAVLAALNDGQPITASAPDGTAVTSQLGVALNVGPNGQDAANVFLDWWFRTDTQVKYSEGTNFGIVVPSERVLGELTDEQVAYLPFSEPNPEYYHVINYEYYSEPAEGGENNLAVILNAWNEFRAN